jgi:phosphate-selective porin OprO/OprP
MKASQLWFVAGAVFIHTGLYIGRAGAEEPAAVSVEERLSILERKYENDQEAAAARAKDAPALTANAKDGFSIKSPDGSFALKIGGYFQADQRFFLNDNAKTLADTFLIRKARLALDGVAGRYYEFKFMPDFGGGAVTLLDAYADAHYWDGLRLRLGKFKAPVGLEQLQPDTATAFIERSLVAGFTPNRDVGAQLWGELWNGAASYAAGVFNGAVDGGSSDGDTADNKDFAARLFLLPFRNSEAALVKNLGIGVAGTQGQQRGTATAPALPSYRTEGPQTFYSYRSDVVADGKLTRVSPQAYWYAGGVGLLGEYIATSQDVKRATTTTTTATLGQRAWQVTASYVLTGESASYKGVKPRHAFDPKNGGWGAWEIAGRYSQAAVDKDAFPRYANPATAARVARAWTGQPARDVQLHLHVVRRRRRFRSSPGGTGAGQPVPGRFLNHYVVIPECFYRGPIPYKELFHV